MENDNRWIIRLSGTAEMDAGSGQSPVEEPADGRLVSISGTVINARGGFPLPGLQVSAWYTEPASRLRERTLEVDRQGQPQSDGAQTARELPREAVEAGQGMLPSQQLGGAQTGLDGRFSIHFDDSPGVQRRLDALLRYTDPALQLLVQDADGRSLAIFEGLAVASSAVDLTLPVTLPEVQVTRDDWQELAGRLEEARLAHASDLVGQFLSLPGGGLAAGWPLEKRQAALHDLEQSFLDPHSVLRAAVWPAVPGFMELRDPEVLTAFKEQVQPALEDPQVREAWAEYVARGSSFADLSEVDWVIGLDELRDGRLGASINRFNDQYKVGNQIDVFAPLFPARPSAPVRYRDYLRAIWTDWASRVTRSTDGGTVSLTPQQALEQLQRRFHQNFTTTDEGERAANEIVIPILAKILSAPAGKGWGFGISPASIEPRGARTPRQYLDYLIGTTGLSAAELGLRYHLDFERPDSALSSPVQENIAALQGFFRDSFQAGPEPYHVDPDVLDQPIVPEKLQGKAPFFLQYDEWLRGEAPYLPENFYDIRRALPVELEEKARQAVKAMMEEAFRPLAERAEWRYIFNMLPVWEKLQEGHRHFYAGETLLAQEAYRQVGGLVYSAWKSAGGLNYTPNTDMLARKRMRVTNPPELLAFTNPEDLRTGMVMTYETGRRERIYRSMAFRMYYYSLYVVSACLGDCALALGNFAEAVFYFGLVTRFPVGAGSPETSAGYHPKPWGYWKDFELFHEGELPYTVNPEEDGLYPRSYPQNWDLSTSDYTPTFDKVKDWTHRVELKFFRLRQGEAMLEWADSLYRTEEPASIARARELYKGVLWLHGEAPPVLPSWAVEFDYLPIFRPHNENPAVTGQKARARAGFFKIEAGLNYYGEREDLVPVLRYRSLKESADRLAAQARSAQKDFQFYLEKVENALVERMKLSNLLQKAVLQASIAREQEGIAQHNVSVAQSQVAAVEAAVEAKKKEIEDADSLFSQFGDFVSGMVKTFTSLPDDTKSAVGAGFSSELTGKELVGQGMLGLGAGASIMTGFGVFAVAGYMSMSSMADAANGRMGELRDLTQKALPAARAAAVARQREVTIAGYVKAIAQADIDLARDLIHFEENRFLNLNFWAGMAKLMKRLLRRYLELGARTAWLAERALAYEQDRELNIIRMDYYPAKLQGITGADLLQADLAELEATRLEGIKRTVPVKNTLSLARDFPLQFGQLKRTGRCVFRTSELPLQRAHPGTTGYRVRAISTIVQQSAVANPLRGILVNQGISILRPGQNDARALVRPAEVQPVSEFRLREDMQVYGLPDETLLTFEGSGIETFWELVFPAAANPYGLDSLADVLLTFDLSAQQSPALYLAHLAALPGEVRRWALVSAAQYAPDPVKDLAGTAPTAAIEFDLKRIGLPGNEKNRKVKNIALFFFSPQPLDVKARFSPEQPAGDIEIIFKEGLAQSNLPPDPAALPPAPQPLNALLDAPVEQIFQVVVTKSQNPGVSFSGVKDLVLAVEYTADLS